MTAQDLVGIARALVADDKGLLAMDESTPTCNRRFVALGIPQTEEARRFAKWRAVIALGAGIPSRGCIEANAQALARYAALCQEAGLVPVVEPEVLMDGDHTLEECRQVTEEVLRTVFAQLCAQRVMLEGMILKPNMVLPGLACPRQEAVNEVAAVTVKCLLRTVPAAVPGIAFLSGGQSGELASARLSAMNVRFKSHVPWAVAFSYARAIQQPALDIWRSEEAHVPAAQRALYHRAACNRAARRGEYTAAMENAGASQPPALLNTSLGDLLLAGLVKDPGDAGQIIAAAIIQADAPAAAANAPEPKAEAQTAVKAGPKAEPEPDAKAKTPSDVTRQAAE